MVKIYDIEIVKPLYLIYMKFLETGRFPSSWKKANVLPIIDLFHFYLFVGKYLKNWLSTPYMNIFAKINS